MVTHLVILASTLKRPSSTHRIPRGELRHIFEKKSSASNKKKIVV